MELSYVAHQQNGVVYLMENVPVKTPVVVLEITDPENRIAGSWYIEGDMPFSLKAYEKTNNRYWLATSKPLDYESEQQYDIDMMAQDQFLPNLLYKVNLKVQIVDVNDNSPQFSQSMYVVSIEENNSPGAFLMTLTVVDPDSGQNGEVNYYLSSQALRLFALNSSSGVLTVSTTLDRETNEDYTFTVTAVDYGSPSRSSNTTVVVNVLDQNDNQPVFLTNEFVFFIPENFPMLGAVGIINITDKDAGSNGHVNVTILNGGSSFFLDKTEGILRCSAPIDREKEVEHMMWIEAKDKGNPALSSIAKVTVIVLDVNDNPPQILLPNSNRSWQLVTPNTAQGSMIAEVYAIDYDAGMNGIITYSITAKEAPFDNLFGINASSGNIMLQEMLQERHSGLYRLLVKVTDQGNPQPLYSHVIINLFVNDTVGNLSYLHSLLETEPHFKEAVGKSVSTLPKNQCSFPSIIPIAISVIACSAIFCVVGVCMFLQARRTTLKHKKKLLDAQIPLKTKQDYIITDSNDTW
nr:PREDICTED: protocadherin-20-like [Latimeria chalumnae]|eukprot:XP_005987630.2 PREDICTED: protocadherin-20-like [Latimeria chalumnae]